MHVKQFNTMSELGDNSYQVSKILREYFEGIKNRDIIILHHTDMDGISAREILRSFIYHLDNIGGVETIAYNYEKDFDFDLFNPERKDVIAVDLSLKDEDIKKISNGTDKFIMLDHHITSIRQFGRTGEQLLRIVKPDMTSDDKDFSQLIFVNVMACGTKIVYDVLKKTDLVKPDTYAVIPSDFNNINSEVVDLVDQYDRWVYTTKEPVYLNEYFYGSNKIRMPYEISGPFVIGYLTAKDERLEKILTTGMEIYEAKKKLNEIKADNFTEETVYIDKNNKSYKICRGFGFGSSLDFGDKILRYDICESVRYYDERSGRYTVSLYTSDPDIDVSKIAEEFGGGGHPGAAGFCSKEYI